MAAETEKVTDQLCPECGKVFLVRDEKGLYCGVCLDYIGQTPRPDPKEQTASLKSGKMMICY